MITPDPCATLLHTESRSGQEANRLGISRQHLQFRKFSPFPARFFDQAHGFLRRVWRAAEPLLQPVPDLHCLQRHSVPFRLQEPFDLNCRHATRTRGSNGLPIRPVLHVTRMKHAGDVSPCAAVRNDVAVGV